MSGIVAHLHLIPYAIQVDNGLMKVLQSVISYFASQRVRYSHTRSIIVYQLYAFYQWKQRYWIPLNCVSKLYSEAPAYLDNILVHTKNAMSEYHDNHGSYSFTTLIDKSKAIDILNEVKDNALDMTE